MVRGPVVMQKTLGEMGVGREGTEGNGASAFPVHLGTGKPVGLLDLILCLWSLPPAAQSPSPAPKPHLGPYFYTWRTPSTSWA